MRRIYALLSKSRFILAVGLLFVGFGMFAHAQGPTSQGVVLWNKLGSDSEVQNSEFGPDFGMTPGVLYVDGVYGDALATTGGGNGGGGYLTMSPEDFFPADKTKGTVEVWVQKRMQQFIPYQTPLVGIFGFQPYGGGYQTIRAFWSDGFTGRGGVEFALLDSSNGYHQANDLGWDNVPVGQWVHMAFVWDLAGIDGTLDKLRIYRDGVVVATNTNNIPDLKQDTSEVKILGHHAYSRFNQPTAYLDNLIVWDHAKSDFSHRFNESPLNNSPVAVNDEAASDQDISLTIDVLANDSDDDGDSLTIDSVTQGANGSVVNNGTDVSYTRNPGFNGTDSFTYTISDGKGGTATATVHVTMTPDITVPADATLGDGVTIGAGSNIKSGAVIGDGATIGQNATIRQNATIGDGATVGDDALVKADASLGAGATLGDNATLGQNASVGSNSAIGSGSHIKSGASVGQDAQIGINVTVGKNATVGERFVAGDNSHVKQAANLGNDITLGAAVVIGQSVTIGDHFAAGDNSKVKQGANLGNHISLGADSLIGDSVTIADNVTIGERTTVKQGTSIGADTSIGNDTLIKKQAQIGERVTIGNNVLVKANTLIADDAIIPDGTTIQ